jgi:hypothetical protein
MVNPSLCWNRNFLLPDAVIKMSERCVDAGSYFYTAICGLPQPGVCAAAVGGFVISLHPEVLECDFLSCVFWA